MSPFWLSLGGEFSSSYCYIDWLRHCYWMNRCKWSGIAVLDALITLLVLPPVVVGFALLMVFTPGYAFGAWLESHGLGVVFTAKRCRCGLFCYCLSFVLSNGAVRIAVCRP